MPRMRHRRRHQPDPLKAPLNFDHFFCPPSPSVPTVASTLTVPSRPTFLTRAGHLRPSVGVSSSNSRTYTSPLNTSTPVGVHGLSAFSTTPAAPLSVSLSTHR